ncbi:hypothetical protein BV898_19788 [Hypsibius exemplaris]|uniref:Uncharacterized protein n=1 Tax=Hypsibius exemplaris TaxID=2072580 RepID=A0A9X6RPS1_HYPEX|nr:hypothetical protein BV898_19788 [Hypsibius exemplaris]
MAAACATPSNGAVLRDYAPSSSAQHIPGDVSRPKRKKIPAAQNALEPTPQRQYSGQKSVQCQDRNTRSSAE